MKDEEMAKRFREDLVCSTTRYIGQENYKYIEQAFLAGLHEGQPKWHKITDWKNQEQFPDNICKKYLVYINLKYLEIKQYVVCTLDITEGCRQFYFDDGGEEDVDPEDVIAWKEIVLPKESE